MQVQANGTIYVTVCLREIHSGHLEELRRERLFLSCGLNKWPGLAWWSTGGLKSGGGGGRGRVVSLMDGSHKKSRWLLCVAGSRSTPAAEASIRVCFSPWAASRCPLLTPGRPVSHLAILCTLIHRRYATPVPSPQIKHAAHTHTHTQ